MINNVIKIGMKKAIKAISRRLPIILAGVGVIGFIASTVVACKLTRKVDQIIEEKEEVKGESLTKKEEILTKAKIYFPSILLIIASTLCIGSSTFISHKRNLALSAALMSSQKALEEYKEATIETVGKEAAKDIHKKMTEKKMEDSCEGETERPDVITTGNGYDVIYDDWSGRYFTSSRNSIEMAVNHVNAELLKRKWVSLNDFYDHLGLDGVRLGENYGWSHENFVGEEELIAVDLIPAESPWGQPMFILECSREPAHDTIW